MVDSETEGDVVSLRQQGEDPKTGSDHSVALEPQQEVTGVVDIPESHGNYLVVTDSWPSLALALKSLRVDSLQVVFLGSNGSKLCRWFEANNFGVKFEVHSGYEGLSLLCGSVSGPWTFIWTQISDPDIEKQATSILQFHLDTTPSASIHGRGGRKNQGLVLSHKRCGGLTNSRWWIKGLSMTAAGRSCLFEDVSLERKLKHVMKSTEKGITCGKPSSIPKKKRKFASANILSGEDTLPFGSDQIDVIAQSVFSVSGFVRRRLTPAELLDAYDMQISCITSLLNSGETVIKEFLPIIVNSPPEKVAYRFAKASLVVASSKKNSSSPMHDIGDEQETVILDGDLSSSKPPSDPIAWLKQEICGNLNDEKAARNDDLPPDVTQWDDYIINHFDYEEESKSLAKYCSVNRCIGPMRKPLICVGGETTERHTHLFNLLRKRLLVINKRNLVRSFCRYLHNTYGSDWTSLFSANIRNELKSKFRNRKRKRIPGSTLSVSKIKAFYKDIEVGKDVLGRYGKSTWWDWADGSTLHFWRWHPSQIPFVRDGMPVHRFSDFKPYMERQRWPKDPTQLSQMAEKIMKVIKRRYISGGSVVSLTGFFAVPKGASDIRMVYDATKCGLNDTIWAPTFFLPTIDCTMRQLPFDGFMSDIDLGEMFLNFPIDENIRRYVGIDVTALKDELIEAGLLEPDEDIPEDPTSRRRLFLRWTRCLMGLKCSPYNCVRAFAWAEEFIRGDVNDTLNPFHYSHVILNLPGSDNYDPGRPRIYRWNLTYNCFSGNFEVYIDDIRCSSASYRNCVKVARQVASRANYLGIQDAARKRRFPSQNPGVWSGAKCIITADELYATTTQAKWEKGKGLINSWLKSSEETGLVNYKELESGRGFLIHLGRTYPMMVPYFKGIHHLLESWRAGRDVDGWRLNNKEWKSIIQAMEHRREEGDSDIRWEDVKESIKEEAEAAGRPTQLDITKVERFLPDLTALKDFFIHEKPPRRLMRAKKVAIVRYGFGDASGGGFGATWDSLDGVSYRFGIWGSDNSDKSSNFRELNNLVETLELAGDAGDLTGVEIFVMTDNSTAERAYFKGSSTSKLLHQLVHRLRSLELTRGCAIHLIHVAGTRMISQGTDGLSRGNIGEGVMKGISIRDFIPLHQTALERQGHTLETWLREWTYIEGDTLGTLELLTPFQWYSRGHDQLGSTLNSDLLYWPSFRPGLFLWAPAPSVAEVALEELRKARLKRQESAHIFICPRLMEPSWRRHLNKSADIVFEIPAKFAYWNTDMHEPLILALYFPYLSHRPWHLKGSPSLLGVGKLVQSMWKAGEEPSWSALRQLWVVSRSLPNLSPKLVFKMLRSQSNFKVPHCRCNHRRGSCLEEKEGCG